MTQPKRGQGCRITGWGSALPDRVVDNHEISEGLETSHDWIVERTGIFSRRIGGTTHSLAVEAGRLAIENARLTPDDIDMVVLATSTPMRTAPATACGVQNELGISGGAFDLQAVCAGFVYAITVADGLISTGATNVLVIGSDTLSKITDFSDRSVAPLFADGAGAVVLSATTGRGELLASSLKSDGSLERLLYCEHGGYWQMVGKEVFRHAVSYMTKASREALDKAGLTIDDVDLLIPHQANLRIIESACKKLGISMDKVACTIDYTANTSSASIPIALDSAARGDRLNEGDVVLFCGFGAGMTSGAVVMRWQP